MRLLITGICGFVGSTLARALVHSIPGLTVHGLDNFSRPGSESNRGPLKQLGITIRYGDVRSPSDLEALPEVDWVIDAAAIPTVLAGLEGQSSSRQLCEHNVAGTVNLLELCKRTAAGIILLSTSRVYSIAPLASLEVRVVDSAFAPVPHQSFPSGVSRSGVTESFSTTPPISLYGATKLASEILALEYGETFGFPVFVNRCGVLAGGGQFGRPDQGIYSYWINSWIRRRPLRYIGFDGQGHQVRDCLHPRDLAELVAVQMHDPGRTSHRILNVGGGISSAMSLRQLSAWCTEHLGPHDVSADPEPRPFDIPWLVLDPSSVTETWDWQPRTPTTTILEEIADHAHAHPEWLDLSSAL